MATLAVDGREFELEVEDDGAERFYKLPDFPSITGKVGYEDMIENWMNPRADVDCLLGTMFTVHSRYILGGGKNDETAGNEENLWVAECDHCQGFGVVDYRWDLFQWPVVGSAVKVAAGTPECIEALWHEKSAQGHDVYMDRTECPQCEGTGEREYSPKRWAEVEHGATVVLPLFLMDHSGISMSTGSFGCPWDSGQVGIIFDTPKALEEAGGEWTPEKIKESLESEVKVYDAYLTGQVLYFAAEDPETGTDEQLGVFYTEEEAEAELLSQLECVVRANLKEIKERDDMAARGVVTT